MLLKNQRRARNLRQSKMRLSWLQKWISKRKPWVFNNSKLPVWLSKFAPIDIFALSFACFVFCRAKIPKTTERHETIHYHQQIELLFVVHWVLYFAFYLIGLVRYRDAKKAYKENPFEREAYSNAKKTKYLENRPLWNWVSYIKG